LTTYIPCGITGIDDDDEDGDDNHCICFIFVGICLFAATNVRLYYWNCRHINYFCLVLAEKYKMKFTDSQCFIQAFEYFQKY
jgi:hypothetical protein